MSFRVVSPSQRSQVRRIAEHFNRAGLEVLVTAQRGGAMALHVAKPGLHYSVASLEPVKRLPADPTWPIVFRSGKPWEA
jgi:hypothetical protein